MRVCRRGNGEERVGCAGWAGRMCGVSCPLTRRVASVAGDVVPHPQSQDPALTPSMVPGRPSSSMIRSTSSPSELGSIPRARFAERAAVPDLPLFGQCIGSDRSFTRIDAGKDIAGQLGIRGVPTVLVNGWMLPPGADSTAILSVVKDIRADREPSWGG